MSSVRPSARCSSVASAARFTNGSTAIEIGFVAGDATASCVSREAAWSSTNVTGGTSR